MRLSERLYDSVKDIWPCYLETPFVREMAEGTLAPDRFRYYLLQDYAYLSDYIKIFAVCITKTNDYHLIKFLSNNINATLEESFRVHVPYMKRMGIEEQEILNVVPHIVNSGYSHYMICEAQAGSVLTGLVELLNCSWSYAYIAEQMTARYPNATLHEFYGQWFQSYIGEEYQEANQYLIDMVDRLGQNSKEEEIQKFCNLFQKCSQFELSFWQMSYRMDDKIK